METYKALVIAQTIIAILAVLYFAWIHVWVISHCNKWLEAYKERTLYWKQASRNEET